ncbi:hypothetical protein PN441_16655, partial [Spirulina major CS-329]
MSQSQTTVHVRTHLVEALNIDLVGPNPDQTQYAHEILSQAPSKWYLSGFLAPMGAALPERSDDDEDDLDQGVETTDCTEDSHIPEGRSARTVPFPASMGLSFLLSGDITHLKARISWGDYFPIEIPPT